MVDLCLQMALLKIDLCHVPTDLEASDTSNFLEPVLEDDDSFEKSISTVVRTRKEAGRKHDNSVRKKTFSLDEARLEELRKYSNGGGLVIENPLALKPEKPHPLRSPMKTFFRNNTIPRSSQKGQLQTNEEYRTRSLTISPNASAWSLEDEQGALKRVSTSDGTPFSRTCTQLYYPQRPEHSSNKKGMAGKPYLSPANRSASSENTSSGSSRHGLMTDSREYAHLRESLRRRANSLDCLPSPTNTRAYVGKNASTAQYTSSDSKSNSPFSRTSSLSQRSPFRKRIAFADTENSVAGIKDLRPRSLKRCKNHLDALFDSIERQDLDEVKRLVVLQDCNINDLNSDHFTPLDVALMNGEREIAQLLMLHGAIENPAFVRSDNRARHLEQLIEKADAKVNDYTAAIVNSIADVKDSERQLREWEWRLYMLRIMQNGLNNLEPPAEYPVVSVAPLSDSSAIVIVTPARHSSKDIITKFRVEWSRDEFFHSVEGEHLLLDMRNLQYVISRLEKNVPWFIRVSAGNMKGFGPPAYPDPPYVIPSSWHEWNNSHPRYLGCQEKLVDLLCQLSTFQRNSSDKNLQLTTSGEFSSGSSTSPKLGRKNSVMKGFTKYTNLIFNTAPKLLKRIKGRGVYLAALLYNEEDERVLVTMDENLPVVEVDDSYSKSITQEYYWLSKISCTWEDAHQMLQDSSRGHSSQAILFRRKLLQASMVLQNATGVHDLGHLYYRPFKDHHGSLLLLTINRVRKSLSGSRTMTMKWTPIAKLLKKTHSIHESIAPEKLIPSLQEMVTYHSKCKMPLSRGLYLGYMKLRTTVESLSIVVPENSPNMLPHVKVRDVPNVTREDWEFLQSLNDDEVFDTSQSASVGAFESKLKNAAQKLFLSLGIVDEYSIRHRIYNREVIELNEDVLFIIIFPPVEDVCTPPGQMDSLSVLPGYTTMPLQHFEMINMSVYQPDVMRTYARLSSLLELENLVVQQVSREAFSPSESSQAKERQLHINNIQQRVEDCWKGTRWVIDTVHAAQNKHHCVGIPIGCLYNPDYFSITHYGSQLPNDNVSIKNGFSISKSTCIVRVHGTEELGLSETQATEIVVNTESTTQDVIRLAARELYRILMEGTGSAAILSDENLQHLGLVVVAGSKEKCLKDDLRLLSLQNPWERGKLFLRLKKEALKATKLSKTTPV